MGKSVKLPSVSVVCPLYNAQDELLDFDRSLKKQKGINLVEIRYILTESQDHTEDLLNAADISYLKIKKEAFSHSLVREDAAMKARGDIIVFLTQDVEIRDDEFLAKLVAPIVSGEANAAYARQKTKYNNIEKYTRAHNYPARSFIVTKKDISKRGLRTFFFSDAAGAVDASVFRGLEGYDGKDLPISEDMYLAYKIIIHGGKIKYVADAVCYHSHNFKLSELYGRYKQTGKFMKQNPEIAKHGINKAGGGMAKSILKDAAKDKNLRVLGGYLPNMMARYAGMTRGKMSSVKKSSAHNPKLQKNYILMRKGER